jgi:hypothetical protein
MHIRPNRFRAVPALSVAIALVLLSLLAVAPPVRADHNTIPWATPLPIATSAANEQGSTVITDGKGHIFIFYVVSNGPSFNNISMTEYTTSGTFGYPGFVTTRQVTTDPTSARTVHPGYPPSAAVDAAGNLYVGWVKQAGYTGGRGDDIYVSRSTDGGSTWVPALASAPNGLGADDYPSIAISPTGRLWLGYAQYWSGWNNITAAYSDTGGASFTGYTNLTTPAGRFYAVTTPSTAVDPTGRAYVAYSQQEVPGYYHVFLAWTDTGALWTSTRISTYLPTFAYFPSVIPEANGKIHVAWWDNRFAPYGGTTIWYRQSPDRGTTWLPEVLLSSDLGPAAYGRVSARLLGQNLVVVYQSSLGSTLELGQANSADDGSTWYPGVIRLFEHSSGDFSSAMDENGTVWLGMTQNPSGNNDIWMSWWNGPPSPPAAVAVARGTGQLTVSWSAPPEKDVVAYKVWRSVDGSTYSVVATAAAPTTSWTDTGLANGTYWYRVTALDNYGTSSHPSTPVSGTVGPTTAEMIAALQAQITALQAQLSNAQANISALQSQITALQNQVTALQNSQAANDAATAAALANLRSQINSLQNQLNQTRAEQATQTMSYVNMALAIIIVLLVVMLLLQMRRPRNPVQVMAPAPPNQVVTQRSSSPRSPEDEL